MPTQTAQLALQNANIFQGETTTAAGRIYVRIDRSDLADLSAASSDLRMECSIRGPLNKYATTLPSTIPLQPVASDEALMATAVVPDPCTWTIDLPSTYQVEIRLYQGDEQIAGSTSMFGFRRFGVVGSSFFHEGKRWVFRGASIGASLPTVEEFQRWRESRMACVVSNPDDAFLSAACEIGVMVLAICDLDDAKLLQRRMQNFAALPAVIAAVTRLPAAQVDRSRLGSLLVSSNCGDGDFTIRKADAEKSLPDNGAKPAIVTCAPDIESFGESPAELRRACEKLQAKIAPQDFAGFAAIKNQ